MWTIFLSYQGRQEVNLQLISIIAEWFPCENWELMRANIPSDYAMIYNAH